MAEVRVGWGLRAWAVAAAAFTYVAIVLGAIVRVTGSGLGCGDDWPLCHGYLIPIFDPPTFIEWSHRLAASLVGLSLAATATLALWKYRPVRQVTSPVLAACGLLGAQILLGALTVKMELSPAVVALHLGVAQAVFAAALWAATMTFRPIPLNLQRPGGAGRPPRLLIAAAAAVYGLLITGAVVAASGAKAACLDWPLCHGSVLPATVPAAIHMSHRYAAAAVGLLVAVAVVQVCRSRPRWLELRRAGAATMALFLAQVAIGALNVLLVFPAVVNALHIATASAVWGAMVVLTVLALQTGQEGHPADAQSPALHHRLADR